MDRRSEIRGRHGVRLELYVPLNVGLRQAGEVNPASYALACELGKSRCEWIPDGRIDVAIRSDDENLGSGKLAGEEPQEQQRGLVRGVQVIQHEHPRALRCGISDEGGRRVEKPEARALRIRARRAQEYLADAHEPQE